MASKGQMSGMRGVFLVAAELAKHGFIVSPTSRSAAGADLLVTSHDCSRAFSVQVKTSGRTASFWLMSDKAQSISSKSHVYVFVMIRQKKELEAIEFYVVPSRFVSQNTYCYERTNSTYYAISKISVGKYKDRWPLFGKP